MYIDTHSHLCDDRINLQNITFDSINKVITLSYNKDNLKTTLSLAKNSELIKCGLGIHPQYCNDWTDNVKNYIIQNIKKIVCIGEIGLDTRFDNVVKQQQIFIEQIEIAQKYKLPTSIHLIGENSFKIFFDIIKNYNVVCVLHCFGGNYEQAKKAIDSGHYLSFACNITYKKNTIIRSIIKQIPIQSILIETDSPSMLPATFCRKGINTPNNIHFVAEKIAEIKNLPLDFVAKVTSQNAKKIFKL